MKRRLRSVLISLAVCAAAAHAIAVGTRRFTLEDGDDFTGGSLEGVAVDSSGRVQAGFNLGKVPLSDAVAVWSILVRSDGSVLLGTGNEGKVLRVRQGKSEVVADTGALVATSVVEAWDGEVVIGTMPEGKLHKLSGDKLTELVQLEEGDHVWDLAYDPKTQALFAATGPEGKLWRVTRDGQAEVYYDAEEQHLMSVAVAPDGSVYAGASDKAKLYHLTGPGRADVLYDFGRTEVRDIAIASDGTVYAIANEISSGTDRPKRRRRTSGSDGPSADPAPPPPKTKGKGTLYRFSPDGTPAQLLDDTDEHFVSLALDRDENPYVGTGAEGRVYTVDNNRNSVLVADTEERQIGALALSGQSRYLAGSDPAVLHPVKGIGGVDAVWTSKVFDAGLRARYGQLSWQASGALEFSSRTGGTEEPDDTWSDWSQPMVQPSLVQSPAGRFIQVRARWSRDKDAVLRAVQIPFITDNLRTVITQVNAGASDKSKSSKGSEVEASGGPITEEPSTEVSLSWEVDNPDKDEVRYRLQYRFVGTDTWYDILEPSEKLTKESYSWETANLPEGKYRVRVVASDELSNPPDRVKRHELESGIVVVDNTPPVVQDLRYTNGRVRGTVIDGVGPVSRIEIAVVGKDDWHPYYPEDGIFDEQREEFDADVTPLLPAPGPALFAVRVYDSQNNFVVKNVAR